MYPTKKLGEIVKTIRGITYKPEQVRLINNGIACFRTKNIQEKLDESDIIYIDENLVKNDEKYLQDGDLLISSANSLELLGKCCLIEKLGYKATLGGFISCFRPSKDFIDYNYFYYFYNSSGTQKKVRNFSKKTTGIANLQLKELEKLPIPLPPLPTQKLIVQKLDSAFENIDKNINLTKENLKNLEELNKSVLEKVFTEGQYEIKNMGDLFDITSSKRVFQSDWKKTGVPFYRAREIVKLSQKGYVDNDLYISNEMYNEYSNKYGIPQKNDIMVTGVGTLGICYVVKKEDKFYFKDGNIIWFKNKNIGVNSSFIEYGFKSNYIRAQIDNTSGSVVGTYTIQNAKNTKIPLPPLQKQKEIVSYLDQVFEKNKQLKTKYELQLKELEELKQSLLKEAFEGRLVKE